MGLLSGVGNFFALDISGSALRLVELKGSTRVKSVRRYLSFPVDPKIIMSDAPTDQKKLTQAIAQAIEQLQPESKNVVIGIPSNKVFTNVVDFDAMPLKDLQKSVPLQADSFIPTSLSESKIDWAYLGPSPKEQNKVEILLSSAPNSFIERRVDLVESLGLNVIGVEPNSLAITRAVVPVGSKGGLMVVDIDAYSTDIVVVLDESPRLVRAIPIGSTTIIKTAAQNLNVSEEQAEQYVFKFGLSQDKLEGQVAKAVASQIETIISEMEKSIKFFEQRYGKQPIQRIFMAGGAAILPEFPLYVANHLGLSVEIANAWRNTVFPVEEQNDLLAVSHQFAVAAGLGERTE